MCGGRRWWEGGGWAEELHSREGGAAVQEGVLVGRCAACGLQEGVFYYFPEKSDSFIVSSGAG